MYGIDEIMNMIDWNQSSENQEMGLKLADSINCINVFLQPKDKKNNKNVWENCAKVLSKKTDEKLQPYLEELLEWLQDLNWPGAITILERLLYYKDTERLAMVFKECVNRAFLLGEDKWLVNLSELMSSPSLLQSLDTSTRERLKRAQSNWKNSG